MATATAFPQYQILPPAPHDPALFFNQFQFEKTHFHAVTKESGITFSDKERMHIERHTTRRHKRYIPSFATDPAKLRKVITLAAWRYAHGRKPFPETLSLRELVRLTDKKFARDDAREISKSACEQEHLIHARYKLVNNLQGKGGWLKVKAAVAYRSWLLGQNSCEVAAQLCMSPQQVRIMLWRLCEIAEELGFATFKRRHRAKSKAH
jgi:hypothetical protein